MIDFFMVNCNQKQLLIALKEMVIMPTPKARLLQGTSCIIEKIPYYLRYSKPDESDRYIPIREEYTIERNKKHYFKIGQTVYHKFFNKGIVKAIDYTQNKIIVIFDNKEINLHIPTITKNELLKPYNKF